MQMHLPTVAQLVGELLLFSLQQLYLLFEVLHSLEVYADGLVDEAAASPI